MKSGLKAAATLVALVTVLPALLCYQIARIILGSQRAFPCWSQAFSLLPGHIGVYLRSTFYRWVLPQFGKDVCISFGTILSGCNARFGRDVYVGSFCVLGDVTLEDDILVASHVSVINGGHQHGLERTDIPIQMQQGRYSHVTIGRGTWIGERVVVMADVGKHCVIGAGSVVTKPIPDYAVAVGVPARVTRFRTPDTSGTEDVPRRESDAEVPVAAFSNAPDSSNLRANG